MCLNQYLLFQTSKATMLLIKRYQEIRIPHFVIYTLVPIQPLKLGLYVSLCVCEEKTPKERQGKKEKNEGERVRQRERGRAREKKRDRESVGVHMIIYPPCSCPGYCLRHRRQCRNILHRRQFCRRSMHEQNTRTHTPFTFVSQSFN